MPNNLAEYRNTVILVLRDKLKAVLGELNHYRAYWYSSFHIDEFKTYICKQMETTLPEAFSNHQQNLAEMEQVLRTTPICNVVMSMPSFIFNAKNEYISRNKPSQAKQNDINARYKAFEKEMNLILDSLVKYDGQMDIKKDPDFIVVNNAINLLSAIDSYNKASMLNQRTNLNYITKLYAAYTALSMYEKYKAKSCFRSNTLREVCIVNNIFLKFLNYNYPNGNKTQENNFNIILERKNAVINRIHYILELFDSSLIADVFPEIISFVLENKKVPAELSNLKGIQEITKLMGQNYTLPNAINYILNQAKTNDQYKKLLNDNSININDIKLYIDYLLKSKNELKELNSNIDEEISKN